LVHVCRRSAIHRCEGWHLAGNLLKAVQSWELQRLRSMSRFKRGDAETREHYNKCTAHKLRQIFHYASPDFCTHRILRAVYKSECLENKSLEVSERPLQWARLCRHQLWWETICATTSQHQRVQANLKHAAQGHRVAWEDVFCQLLGSDWRSQRGPHGSMDFLDERSRQIREESLQLLQACTTTSSIIVGFLRGSMPSQAASAVQFIPCASNPSWR